MSIRSVSKVPVEETMVSFQVEGHSFSLPSKESEGFALGCLTIEGLREAQFTSISVERTIWMKISENTTLRDKRTWTSMGPFSPIQFKALMQFERGISNAAWEKHMNDSVAIKPCIKKPTRIKVSEWN